MGKVWHVAKVIVGDTTVDAGTWPERPCPSALRYRLHMIRLAHTPTASVPKINPQPMVQPPYLRLGDPALFTMVIKSEILVSSLQGASKDGLGTPARLC